MVNTTEKIDKLKARLEQLEAKAKEDERKMRTRRLILWGTLIEEMVEKDEEFAKTIRQKAGRKFQRKIDREALGLPIKDAPTNPGSQGPAQQ